MGRFLYFGALWSALTSIAGAKAPSDQKWTERSIYQVMTDRFARSNSSDDSSCDPYRYCGGSWAGIVDRLDYIQDLGFTAVQISPVVENIPNNTKYGEAYHGYWPQNLYALNEHFGTAEDLKNLADELHKRDMYLMVDVVINDMAQAVKGSMDDDHPPEMDWSQMIPFNHEKYYHPACRIRDWNDPEDYQNCWFAVQTVALPDLNTEDDRVVRMIQEWVKGLVGNYSIDGLRIDATKHVDDAYLTNFNRAAGLFTLGEVYSGDTELVCRYEKFVSGLLNFPIHGPMIKAFTAGEMEGLAEKVRTVHNDCKDFSRLATFLESHDIPRFASLVNDTTLAKNAMAFNILSDGIPVVYQGQEQHMPGNFAPYNRVPLWTTGYNTSGPLYNVTASLNKIRNHAIRMDRHYVSNHSMELYLDGSTYVTRKGSEGLQVVSVFSNQGSTGGPYKLTVNDTFSPNTEVMEVLNCSKHHADQHGRLTIDMDEGEPRVFYPSKKMKDSGLCGYHKRNASLSGNGKNSTNGPRKNSTTDETSSFGHQTIIPSSAALFCVLFVTAGWLL
ncbi:putative alpha-amylase [Aspergillus steynii IBT 23096]|uniref:alpha-amylase n=1 Tax=Aspergillus steynii IBT 23096 TaxID=1392250 RepID=A0A2I2GSF7_9EURO|nr:putative alpha-amylase [Aspergillus steynii IBT 23096]PLB55796.1 putative alpha-amylase [Aspergillus steynii IBT 23096]